MKPYSVDFREKILEIKNKESLSIRQLAQRFGVAKSFIQKIIKQHQETGCVNPRRPGGGNLPKLNAEQVLILKEILENNNDFTLEELKDELWKRTRVSVSTTTIWKLSKQLNYSFKKKRFLPPKKITQM
jgi:transposase